MKDKKKVQKKEISEKKIDRGQLTIDYICQLLKMTQKELWETINKELRVPCDWTPKFCPMCGSFLAWLKIHNAIVTCVKCEREKENQNVNKRS